MPDRRIQYLQGHEIDRAKWDQCVIHAPNSLIYNTSIYLDMMADQWNGVVVGDYEAVMPLPWRKKWLLRYHYHVPFIPQGGLSGDFSSELSRVVSRVIFKRISFGDLLLNYANEDLAAHVGAIPMINMTLDLSKEYPHIHKKYHRDLEKNLRRASRHEFSYLPENNIKLPVMLFRKMYGSRLSSVRPVDYERFTGLCLHLHRAGQAIARKVVDSKGKIMAVALLLKDNVRIYNMMNTVLPEGRRKSANHYLFDQLVREFAGSGLILDFEGSQNVGIRKFYENFGALNEPYFWSRRTPWKW